MEKEASKPLPGWINVNDPPTAAAMRDLEILAELLGYVSTIGWRGLRSGKISTSRPAA